MGTVVAIETQGGVAVAGDSRVVDDGTVTNRTIERVFRVDSGIAGVAGSAGDVQAFRRSLDAELARERLDGGDDADVTALAHAAARHAADAGVDVAVAGRDADGVARLREVRADGSVLDATSVALGSGAEIAYGRLEAVDPDRGVDDLGSTVRGIVEAVIERDTDSGGEVDVQTLGADE